MSNHPRCYNRDPFNGTVEVQDGWTEDGRRIMKRITDPMSKGCHQHDPLGEAAIFQWNCDGCRWKP